MSDRYQRALKVRAGLEACIELGDITQSPETLVEEVMDIMDEDIDPNDYATALVMIGQWIAENKE